MKHHHRVMIIAAAIAIILLLLMLWKRATVNGPVTLPGGFVLPAFNLTLPAAAQGATFDGTPAGNVVYQSSAQYACSCGGTAQNMQLFGSAVDQASALSNLMTLGLGAIAYA